MPFFTYNPSFSWEKGIHLFRFQGQYMKWLARITAFVFFVFFFSLALKNTQETALYFFWGYALRGPLVLIVLCFFVAGSILGLFAMLPTVFRNRRELTRLKKTVVELEAAVESHRKADKPTTENTESVSTDH